MSLLRYVTHPNVTIDPAVEVPRWSLSPEGRRRARRLLEQPWIVVVGHVVSSDETKALETAEIIATHLGLDVEVRAGVGENDRSATGFVPPERFEALPDRFFAEPGVSVGGWECATDAQLRITTNLADLFDHDPGHDTLIVGHGGVGTRGTARSPKSPSTAATTNRDRAITSPSTEPPDGRSTRGGQSTSSTPEPPLPGCSPSVRRVSSGRLGPGGELTSIRSPPAPRHRERRRPSPRPAAPAHPTHCEGSPASASLAGTRRSARTGSASRSPQPGRPAEPQHRPGGQRLQFEIRGGHVLAQITRADTVTDLVENREQFARDQVHLAQVRLARIGSDTRPMPHERSSVCVTATPTPAINSISATVSFEKSWRPLRCSATIEPIPPIVPAADGRRSPCRNGNHSAGPSTGAGSHGGACPNPFADDRTAAAHGYEPLAARTGPTHAVHHRRRRRVDRASGPRVLQGLLAMLVSGSERFTVDDLYELTDLVTRNMVVTRGPRLVRRRRNADVAMHHSGRPCGRLRVRSPRSSSWSRRTDAYPAAGANMMLGDAANPAALAESLWIATRLLAGVVRDADASVQAVIFRRPRVLVAGPDDFVPRAAMELILHAHDVSSGLGERFEPPAGLSFRLREHTRPWPMAHGPCGQCRGKSPPPPTTPGRSTRCQWAPPDRVSNARCPARSPTARRSGRRSTRYSGLGRGDRPGPESRCFDVPQRRRMDAAPPPLAHGLWLGARCPEHDGQSVLLRGYRRHRWRRHPGYRRIALLREPLPGRSARRSTSGTVSAWRRCLNTDIHTFHCVVPNARQRPRIMCGVLFARTGTTGRHGNDHDTRLAQAHP